MSLNKKYLLIAASVLILAWLAIGIARADVPLTPAHSCAYSDPAQTGQGLVLDVLPSGYVIGSLFLGSVPHWYGHAVWLSVQGELAVGDGDSQTFPVYESRGAVVGEYNPLSLIPMGQIRLTATGPTTVVAELRIDGRGDVLFSPPPPTLVHTFNFRCLL